MNSASKTLIFVCSGNTCRSPLAWAAWQALPTAPAKFQAKSGGLWAQDGAPAAAHSTEIARAWGVNLQSHRARTLTRAQVLAADCIAVMTSEHADALREHFGFNGKLVLLGDFDDGDGVLAAPPDIASSQDVVERAILDPFGGSREAYQSCAAQIRRSVAGLARHLNAEKD